MKINVNIVNVILKNVIILLMIVTPFFILNNFPLEYFLQSTHPDMSSIHYINRLNYYIPRLMNAYDIPGVNIALIQQGKIIWVNSYGYADIECKIPMTPATYCRVESISKSVTAWGVMKLAEKGIVSLDKPITQYLRTWEFPLSPYNHHTITIRHLLSHTAGLPLGTIGVRYNPDETIPTLQQSLYRDAVLMAEPGELFSYSNTGFNLLELLIEKTTGQSFAYYMQQEVLNPLGMKRSSYRWNNCFNPFPKGYTISGKSILAYVYPEKGAGGLFSTVEDIAMFVIAGMTTFNSTGKKVISNGSIQKMYEPVVAIPGLYGFAFPWYGLGHFIEYSSCNVKAISHGGQGTGWMTHFHAIPQTGDGIVMLTNSQRSWPFFAYILNDWAGWIGFGTVGMAAIMYAEIALWGLLYLLWIILLIQIYHVIKGLLMKTCKVIFIRKQYTLYQVIRMFVSVFVIALLLWAVTQEYLFITSVFPRVSIWIGSMLLLLAIFTIAKALCIEKEYFET